TSVIGGHALHPRRAVDLAAQIADAVADMHEADLVHGNLTAANVIVTPKGMARVLECGLAPWTKAGEHLNANPADESDDIRAIGGLLVEMLTGKTYDAKQSDPLLKATHLSVPLELDPLLRRALAPSARVQYKSAATLGAELRALWAILDERKKATDLKS